MIEPAEALLGLGANLGDRAENIRRALALLDEAPGAAVTAVSALYETAPLYDTDQPYFLNAVAALETKLAPQELLDLCRRTEAALNRVRTFPFGPRTIDLDLLSYDSKVISQCSLTIPHPRLAERRFVLEPLVEIRPDWIHPLLGKNASRLLVELIAGAGKSQEVRRLDTQEMGRDWAKRWLSPPEPG